MQWNIEYIESQNYVRIHGAGVFDVKIHSAVYEDLIARPFWKWGTSLMFDNLNVDFGQSDIETMRKASRNYKKFAAVLGACKMALLMKSSVDFGRGRQFEILAETDDGCRIRSFRDEAAALVWLGKIEK